MTYFAINVLGGAEARIVDMIMSKIKNYSFDLIESVINPTAKITQLSDAGSKYKMKSVALSYIYVKTSHNSVEVQPEVYHFLKQIPGVKKILEYNIDREEVDSFCQTVGASLDESEIEVEVVYNEEEQVEVERELLYQINSTKEPKEKSKLLEKLSYIQSNPVKKLKALINEGKKYGHKLISRCKVTTNQRKKTQFRFPYRVFLNTISRIDPNRTLPKNTLINVNYLLPHLVTTLKIELKKTQSLFGK